ncbi:MAG: leucyl aminopeptidase [Acidothermus sp.]|nr:leucyl aminopeptidase [Acidothermus sp.]
MTDAVSPSVDAYVIPMERSGDGEWRCPVPDALAVVGIDQATLSSVIARHGWSGDGGDVLVHVDGSRLVVLFCPGASPTDLRRAAAAVVRRLTKVETACAALPPSVGAEGVAAFVEGLLLGGYRFRLSSTPNGATLRAVEVVARTAQRIRTAFQRAVRIAEGVVLARDLATMPSSTKSPAWLAAQARLIARRCGLGVRVRTERELAEEGFGGILGVGAGSAHPPRLIELTYRPPDPLPGQVVLIGKGVTFDSGGLSLKTASGMVAMKTDMAGGGAVIATMSLLRDLDVRVAVTGLVPGAENMPSGSALRPGDVITHFDGTTVEVLNTDAEGRLILADAIGYARRVLQPDVIVDLATLTGAMSRGLGRRHAGLFATDERLAAVLLDAAERAGEYLWRMPFVEEYRDALDSPIADLANVAIAGKDYGAGGIIAALFLREFARDVPFAHLDIAGPARADADEHEIVKGATGYGVRLLARWLAEPDPLRGLRRRGRRAATAVPA